MKELFKQWTDSIPATTIEEVDRYQRHFELLQSWNERMNLVSRNSLEKAFSTHYIDSIHIADTAHRFLEGRALFDLGSGAGFPGLVMAIRYPEQPITLFEKSLKKQGFLMAAVAHLELKNVHIEGGLTTGKFKGLFLARAVMQRSDLFAFFRKHLHPGSRVILNLGGQREPEPAPATFHLLTQDSYSLPLDCGNRKIEAYEFVPRGTGK